LREKRKKKEGRGGLLQRSTGRVTAAPVKKKSTQQSERGEKLRHWRKKKKVVGG